MFSIGGRYILCPRSQISIILLIVSSIRCSRDPGAVLEHFIVKADEIVHLHNKIHRQLLLAILAGTLHQNLPQTDRCILEILFEDMKTISLSLSCIHWDISNENYGNL